MRFRKLRITVGIAIVLFIFIVANVIILGNFGHRGNSQNDNKIRLLAPIYPETKEVTATATSSDSQPTPESPPTIIHHSIRTRAS